MTDQPSAADTNDTFPDVAEQIRSLTPSFDDVLKERFSAEARVAQNFAMLLAALGIALAAGLIDSKTTGTAAGVGFGVPSAKAGVVLLAATSAFFLIRFLFLAWRDSCAYRLKMFAAFTSINDVAQSMHSLAQDLHRRAKEMEDIVRKRDYIDSEQMQSKQLALRDQVSKMENYERTVGGIIKKFASRSRFIDKYTVAFEITLPCLLVAALVTLFMNEASKFLILL
jgi:hypothetical protein